MAIPAFRAAGAAVASPNNVATPTALTASAPAGRAVGDLLVCVTASRSNSATVATPSGWNLVSGFPKASGTASGGKIYLFTRIATGTASDDCSLSWASLTTGTNGDSCSARILAYQNALETADGTPPAAGDAASTTTITIPAHTTGSPNSLVVGVAIRINDTAHTFTVATFTERSDDHTTSGTGHGTVTADKVNTAAGSSGSAAVTPSNTTSSRTLAVSFGVRAAPTAVTLTSAAETDAAQALVFTKTIRKTLTPATETGAAQAASFAKPIHKSLTAATEAGTAQAASFSKPLRKTLTAAAEADSAQGLSFTKPIHKALAPGAESGAAVALSVSKPIHVTLAAATETDAAVTVAPTKALTLAAAEETTAAANLSVTKTIYVTLTGSAESDQPVALDFAKPIFKDLVAASETGSAEALSVTHVHYRDLVAAGEAGDAVAISYGLSGGPIVITLDPVAETSTAPGLVARKVVALAAAVGVDAAAACAVSKRTTLAPAVELGVAVSLVTSMSVRAQHVEGGSGVSRSEGQAHVIHSAAGAGGAVLIEPRARVTGAIEGR